MAKNKKPLLQEGTIRRMMKLANMDALGDGFINEKYTSLDERGGSKDDRKTGLARKDASQESEDVADYEDPTSPEGKKRRAAAKAAGEVSENLDEQEDDMDIEAEEEVEDVGGEEDFDMEAELDVEEPAEEMEGEVTITDEEAHDIIDLADKLKDAVGDGDEEMDVEGGEEMPMDLEAPGGEMDMEMGIEDEEEMPMQEGLYEAALQGLNIDLVDDQLFYFI